MKPTDEMRRAARVAFAANMLDESGRAYTYDEAVDAALAAAEALRPDPRPTEGEARQWLSRQSSWPSNVSTITALRHFDLLAPTPEPPAEAPVVHGHSTGGNAASPSAAERDYATSFDSDRDRLRPLDDGASPSTAEPDAPAAPAPLPDAAEGYICPPDPGHARAEWDDGRCPKCQAGTLVAWVNGTAYRHCSFVSCDWGLFEDVIVGGTVLCRVPADVAAREGWETVDG